MPWRTEGSKEIAGQHRVRIAIFQSNKQQDCLYENTSHNLLYLQLCSPKLISGANHIDMRPARFHKSITLLVLATTPVTITPKTTCLKRLYPGLINRRGKTVSSIKLALHSLIIILSKCSRYMLISYKHHAHSLHLT